MKKFREEDLILYLYKECSPTMEAAIEQALEAHNIELKERLQVLRRSIKQLNRLKLKSPSKLSVKAVLKYAKEAKRRHEE